MTSGFTRIISIVDLPLLKDETINVQVKLSFLSNAAKRGSVFIVVSDDEEGEGKSETVGSDVPASVASWLQHPFRPHTQFQTASSIGTLLSEVLCFHPSMRLSRDQGTLLTFVTGGDIDGTSARMLMKSTCACVPNKVVFSIKDETSFKNLTHTYHTGWITKLPRGFETNEGMVRMMDLIDRNVEIPWTSISSAILCGPVAKTIRSRLKTARSTRDSADDAHDDKK